MREYYLGRQPIFNTELEVTGYELLYRSQDVDARVNGDQATSQVLLNSFWEMGLEKIVGKHAAFVNLTRRFILNESLIPPPNGQLVLEILEDIEVDDELLTAVGNLKSKGYTIALDDFIYHPKLQPLVRMADIIKIDILALSHQEIDEHLFTLRKFPLKLLAEKVETPEEFDWCKSRGFDYYQGYFLCKPRLIKGRRMPTNRVNTLRLMAELQKPDLDVKQLEKLITQDVTISYRLLHYINSAAFAARDIESIHHAIVYLGKQEICKWASLALLAGIDDKPAALTMTALVRARMCELLAETMPELNHSTAMMIGLFSTLDAMLDAPLEDILADIPLAEGVRNALLRHEGPYAGVLTSTLAYETGTWEDIDFEDDDETRLISIYLRSIEWAETMLGNLKGVA
ncbi:MAG: EAL domain-containing protein [Gammaproteobacteria bacterium]|nr:EAL domain-containing protein [Gammaproteobacteria bacterium]